MIEYSGILAEIVINGCKNNSTLIISCSKDNANFWITFGSQVLGVIVGGTITFLVTYYQINKQNQNEEKSREEEKKRQLLQLGNEAYIGLLSELRSHQDMTKDDTKDNPLNLLMDKNFVDSSSRVFAYGSSEIKELLNNLLKDLNPPLTGDSDRISQHWKNVRNEILELENKVIKELMSRTKSN